MRRGGILAGADVPDPERVEMADRLDHPGRAGVPDVVVADRHGVDPRRGQTCEQRRVEGERQAVRVPAEVVRGRTFEVDEREIRVVEEGPHRPGLTRRPHDRQPKARRRTAGPSRDRREATIPRVGRALAFSDGDVIDRSIEHHVATGDKGPRHGWIERRLTDAR